MFAFVFFVCVFGLLSARRSSASFRRRRPQLSSCTPLPLPIPPPGSPPEKAAGAAGASGAAAPLSLAAATALADSSEPRYCVCQNVSYGDMIACDNPDCIVEWFHYECVGITQQPKGKWFCPQCRAQGLG